MVFITALFLLTSAPLCIDYIMYAWVIKTFFLQHFDMNYLQKTPKSTRSLDLAFTFAYLNSMTQPIICIGIVTEIREALVRSVQFTFSVSTTLLISSFNEPPYLIYPQSTWLNPKLRLLQHQACTEERGRGRWRSPLHWSATSTTTSTSTSTTTLATSARRRTVCWGERHNATRKICVQPLSADGFRF